MVPAWLDQLSIIVITAGFVCCAVIGQTTFMIRIFCGLRDVGCVVALFGTETAIWGYLRYGRLSVRNTKTATAKCLCRRKLGGFRQGLLNRALCGATGSGCALGEPSRSLPLPYGSATARYLARGCSLFWISDVVLAFPFHSLFNNLLSRRRET